MDRLIPFVAVLWLLSPTAMAQSNTEFRYPGRAGDQRRHGHRERDGGEVELRLADIGAPQGTQFLARLRAPRSMAWSGTGPYGSR